MDKRTIYAYIRYSSAEQAKGDSQDRQIRLIKDWCKRTDYDFDKINLMVDEGLSAFKGDHISRGQLGIFWDNLTTGKINPATTVLLVENFDRLSREGGLKALKVLNFVDDDGLVLETLSDGRIYNKETVQDLSSLVLAQISSARSNQESKEKGRRVGDAWAIKRSFSKGKVLTKKRPYWIGYNEAEKVFYPIQERAQIVQRIFDMYNKGHGTAWITCWLNQNHILPWGQRRLGLRKHYDQTHLKKYDYAPADQWLITYVKKILTNISTYGAIQLFTKRDRQKRIPVGEPVEGYYPPVISRQTFDKAQLVRSKRFRTTGRPSRNNGNLFPTLCKCGFCGSSMHYVTKNSSKGEVYLVCSRARYRGGCRYISFPYKVFENSFLRHVRKIPFTEFGRGKEKLTELRSAQLDKEATLAAVERKIQNLANFAMDGQQEVKVLRSRMIDLEREQEGLVKDLARLTKEMADLRGFDENSRTVTSLLEDEGMRDYLTNPDMRHHLKVAVGKMVKEIQVFPAYNLDPRLRATRHFVVHFYDGTTQKCLGQGEPEMIYAKAGTHEASWSPTFAQQNLTLLPSLSGLDSGITEQAFTQPKAKKSS